MTQVGSLVVDLIAQTASFNANIEKAAANLNSQAARMNRSIQSIQDKVNRFSSGMAVLRDTFLSYQLGQFIGQSLDYAASLGEVAQQVGVTTRELQTYRAIGLQVGVTQEEMDKGLSKLTVSIGQAALGAKKQNSAFAALGISIKDAQGGVKGTGQIIEEIADRLAKIEDPAQRAAVEIALFGRAGQKLDTVLTEGRAGIQAYAKRAEELGMVLSDDLIDKADEAADRVAELNAQFRVNFSKIVAENAGAILGLANALAKLTVGAVQFISQWPKLSTALAGAAIGARLGGGPGAAIGAGLGFFGGMKLAASQNDANMDLKYRRGQLLESIERYNVARKSSNSPAFLANTEREMRRQTALTRQAIAASRVPKTTATPSLPEVELPNFLAGGGGSRRAPRAEKDRSAEYLLQYQNDMARLEEDLLRARQDNLSDAALRAELERQMLTIERGQIEKATAADVTEGKLTQAQAEQLLIKDAQIRAEKLLTINTEHLAAASEELLSAQLAANDNGRDILQAQESLAMTAAERRPIALRLLDMDREEEKLRLQHIVDMGRIGKATAAEARAAEMRLGQMDTIYAARREGVMRSTEGPLERYYNDLAMTPAKLNEAVQQIKVDGIQAFSDGIVDAIVNFRSLGDVAKSVIQQILTDLLRLPIQQALLGPLVGAIGGFGGGLSPVNFGALSNAAATVSIPGFATGTSGAPGGWAVVGERGPELLPLRPGQPVIPNHRIANFTAPAARNDNGSGGMFVFNNYAKMTEREARETAAQMQRALRSAQANARRIGA